MDMRVACVYTSLKYVTLPGNDVHSKGTTCLSQYNL